MDENEQPGRDAAFRRSLDRARDDLDLLQTRLDDAWRRVGEPVSELACGRMTLVARLIFQALQVEPPT